MKNSGTTSFRSLATAAAALLAAALLPSSASADVSLAWVDSTRGVSIALDGADNVYTVDYDQAPGGDMRVSKRNSAGVLSWIRSYDQTSTTAWERASWIATDSVGNAFVCGTLMSGFSNPVEAASILMKFGAGGNLLWRRVYESGFDGSAVKKCIVDANNNVYVLGLGTGTAGRVTKIKKFAANGTALWSYFDNAGGLGAPLNIKLTPDNHLLVSGKAPGASVVGYAKIGLDGNEVWNYRRVYSQTAGDSAGDAFGNTYIVHGEYVFNGGTVIKKLDPAGVLLWEHVYDLAGLRVEVGNDNLPIVSGFPRAGAGAAFIKVNASGGLLWSNLDADGPYMLLSHAHMLLDGANNAYLAAGTMSEMAVCKVNSNGTSGWTQTVPFGYAQAIALARTDDDVYLVGGTTARLAQEGTVTPQVPAAPSGLRLGGGKVQVRIAWIDNATNETGYVIERCTGSGCSNFSAIATLPANTVQHADTAVARLTTYRYRLMATGSSGNSPYSNTAAVTTR